MSIESLSNPARSGVAFSASGGDQTLAEVSRGLYVGVAGNVSLLLMDDEATTILFVGVAAGSVLPLRVVKVFQAGTTADSFVALY